MKEYSKEVKDLVNNINLKEIEWVNLIKTWVSYEIINKMLLDILQDGYDMWKLNNKNPEDEFSKHHKIIWETLKKGDYSVINEIENDDILYYYHKHVDEDDSDSDSDNSDSDSDNSDSDSDSDNSEDSGANKRRRSSDVDDISKRFKSMR
jgi:hypothetical protein